MYIAEVGTFQDSKPVSGEMFTKNDEAHIRSVRESRRRTLEVSKTAALCEV